MILITEIKEENVVINNHKQKKYTLDKKNWYKRLNETKIRDFNLKVERIEYIRLYSSKLGKLIKKILTQLEKRNSALGELV